MDTDAVNLALLIGRLALGGMLIYHGVRKLQSIDGTAKWFHSMGMRPGRPNAILSGATEVGAGALMATGLLTTLSATAFVALMVVAAVTVHAKNGFLILNEGWEYVFIIAVFAVMVATLGPGEWSVDNALDIDDDLDGWIGLGVAAVVGVAGAAGQLGLFYRPSADDDAS